MKNQKKLMAVLLAFVVLIGGAWVLYDRLVETVSADQIVVHATQPPETASEEGTARPDEEDENGILAPDFHVYDRDGNTVHLSDFFGKPIVLNFWASWCGPCQREMPDFNDKYAELGGDVHFVMVNMTDGGRETVETAAAFIDENGYGFPVFFDVTGEAANAYGAYSLPTSFFINAEGHVVVQAVGAIDGETLQRGVDMITR